MTTLRTATPAYERVQTMALALIRAWLDEDYWTIDQVKAALAEAGVTMEQAAEVTALMGASLLAEAHGGNSHAASGHVSGRLDDKVAKRVQALTR